MKYEIEIADLDATVAALKGDVLLDRSEQVWDLLAELSDLQDQSRPETCRCGHARASHVLGKYYCRCGCYTTVAQAEYCEKEFGRRPICERFELSHPVPSVGP